MISFKFQLRLLAMNTSLMLSARNVRAEETFKRLADNNLARLKEMYNNKREQ